MKKIKDFIIEDQEKIEKKIEKMKPDGHYRDADISFEEGKIYAYEKGRGETMIAIIYLIRILGILGVIYLFHIDGNRWILFIAVIIAMNRVQFFDDEDGGEEDDK